LKKFRSLSEGRFQRERLARSESQPRVGCASSERLVAKEAGWLLPQARACRLIGRERSVIEAGRTMEQWLHDRETEQRSAKNPSRPRTQYKTQHKTLCTHACATTGISN
jgi:hypothetical protein